MRHGLTAKQLAMKERKFRLLAGELHVETNNDKLPDDVRDLVRTAHDAMCKAFMILEKDAAGPTRPPRVRAMR
jgi:hypothetical protein